MKKIEIFTLLDLVLTAKFKVNFVTQWKTVFFTVDILAVFSCVHFFFNQFIYNLLWVYVRPNYLPTSLQILSQCLPKAWKKSKSWLSACCIFFTLSIHVSNQAFDKLRVWVKKESTIFMSELIFCLSGFYSLNIVDVGVQCKIACFLLS